MSNPADDNSRPPFPVWLKDLCYLGGLIVVIVVFGQGLKSDQRSAREEQARMASDMKAMAEDVRKISQSIPSPEVLNMRFGAIDEKIARLRSDFDFEAAKMQKYKEDLSRQLIKKGVID